MVMVGPVDSEEHEAQHVTQEDEDQRSERMQVGSVRRLELQHHDRDDHGKDPIAERLHPSLGHAVSSTYPTANSPIRLKAPATSKTKAGLRKVSPASFYTPL